MSAILGEVVSPRTGNVLYVGDVSKVDGRYSFTWPENAVPKNIESYMVRILLPEKEEHVED